MGQNHVTEGQADEVKCSTLDEQSGAPSIASARVSNSSTMHKRAIANNTDGNFCQESAERATTGPSDQTPRT